MGKLRHINFMSEQQKANWKHLQNVPKYKGLGLQRKTPHRPTAIIPLQWNHETS